MFLMSKNDLWVKNEAGVTIFHNSIEGSLAQGHQKSARKKKRAFGVKKPLSKSKNFNKILSKDNNRLLRP